MIYAIVPFASEDDIAERIRDLDAPYFDKEAPKVLFVSFHGTAEELSRKLGLSKSGGGTGVVVSVARYHGFGRRSLWEWLERYDDAP